MVRGNLLPPSSEQKSEPRPKVRMVASCPTSPVLFNILIHTTFSCTLKMEAPGSITILVMTHQNKRCHLKGHNPNRNDVRILFWSWKYSRQRCWTITCKKIKAKCNKSAYQRSTLTHTTVFIWISKIALSQPTLRSQDVSCMIWYVIW
jgi:hypothetical protein